MWPFKNKYDKLKRDDVVDAICELEKQGADLERAINDKNEQINTLMGKGKSESSRELKLLYAKKINHLKEELDQDVKRSMYLMYNIKLFNRLKTAIDDNEFITKTSKVSINSLINDQKGLAKYLNKMLKIKVDSEDALVNADNLFNDVELAYTPNEEIYSPNSNDDSLLAIFEVDRKLTEESQMYTLSSSENPNKMTDSLSNKE